jgi:hypothetical protein
MDYYIHRCWTKWVLSPLQKGKHDSEDDPGRAMYCSASFFDRCDRQHASSVLICEASDAFSIETDAAHSILCPE